MSLFGHKSSSKTSLFSGSTPSPLSGSTGAPPPHHKFDWGAAALSFLGVDPKIFVKKREEEDALAQQQQVNAIIDADQNLSPQDKAYAKLNPKAYLDNYMQRFQPMNTGPGGGSRGLPGAGGTISSWQTAPRFDENGTIYGPGNGTTAPPILQRGTKVVPVAPGGQAQVVDSISGAPMMQGGSPATSAADSTPTIEDGYAYRPGPGGRANQANWSPVQGGPSPSGSATFPSIPR